jgi:glutathione S-transferase
MTSTSPKGGHYPSINLPFEEALELYANGFSLCSAQVRLCLAEKKLAYKLNHIHLIETGWYQSCSPDFKRINPGATVPVLVHDGHPIYESKSQIEYLSEKFDGNDLRPPPDAPSKWVNTYALNNIVAGGVDPETMGNCIPGLTMPIFAAMMPSIPVSQILWGLRHHPNKERCVFFLVLKLLGSTFIRLPPLYNMVRASREAMSQHLTDLEELLADKREWVLGSKFTLTDVGLVPIFERMSVASWDHLWADLPHVVQYLARLRARSSYKAAIQDCELKCVKLGRRRLHSWKQRFKWLKGALEGDDGVLSAWEPKSLGLVISVLLCLLIAVLRAIAGSLMHMLYPGGEDLSGV